MGWNYLENREKINEELEFVINRDKNLEETNI